MTCDWIESHLEAYLEDRLSTAERAQARRHIHACPRCFETVLAREPLELLAPLADEPAPEESWEEFWPAIRDGIEVEPPGATGTSGWPAAGTFRRAAAILLAVAAMAGAAGLGLLAPRRPVPLPIASIEGEPVVPPAALERARPLPPTVEQVRTPDSREIQVYTMQYRQEPEPGDSVDSAAQVTELVLIVDAGLDL